MSMLRNAIVDMEKQMENIYIKNKIKHVCVR